MLVLTIGLSLEETAVEGIRHVLCAHARLIPKPLQTPFGETNNPILARVLSKYIHSVLLLAVIDELSADQLTFTHTRAHMRTYTRPPLL